jgi:hypothetical protein
MDPKDAPYASFRFHYRPLSKLRLLNIVLRTRERTSFNFLKTASMEAESGNAQKAEASSIGAPPELFPTRSVLVSRAAQPSKMARDGHLNSDLNRPLPPLPTRRPLSPVHRGSPEALHSDVASVSSSIYTSVSDEGLLREVRFGVGTQVSIHPPLKPEIIDITPAKCTRSANSDSDGEMTVVDGDGEQPPKPSFLSLSEGEWMKPTVPGVPSVRGLLGTDLRAIPLTGPSGDLMKKLRSEDPFGAE